MGYFDNPKHRAEWERELSSLREQKARLYGYSSASRDTEREVSREYEKASYEQEYSAPESEYSEEFSAANDYSEPVREERSAPAREERSAPAREERSAPAREERSAPAREERSAPAREERSAPVREERSAPVREQVRSTPARRERPARVNVHPDEEYRIRMTFQELLAMENLGTVQKTTSKPHEMQRQKEVSHAL